MEGERREREVVAVEPQERDSDQRCEQAGDEGRGEDGEQRGHASVGVDEAGVRIDSDREDGRRVRADEKEGALSERYLPRIPHEEREPDRHQRIEPHAVVEGDVERRELVRQPTGEHRPRQDQPDPHACGQGDAGTLNHGMGLVRDARDLGPRAPSDEHEHDDQGDGQAVLRIDVADDHLLEDPERVAAEQGEPDGSESAEDRGRESIDGNRDIGAVRHRVARREQRASERTEGTRADERDDRERADVETHELGGAP